MTQDYPQIEFGSIDELCFAITLQTKSWDTVWYRGCTSPSHKLQPTIFRDDFQRKREGYLAVEFRRRAHSKIAGISTRFDWLCAMQHYGVPTRLLDWSESLAVALYFSIGDIDWKSAHPTVWLLDPFELARLTEADSNIPIANDPVVTANADIPFCDDWETSRLRVSNLPIPVAPNFLFERLSAQNGTFTIHGTDIRPLDDIVRSIKPEGLLKFVARPDRVLDIVNSIRLLRPSSDAMFPDIDGMKYYLV